MRYHIMSRSSRACINNFGPCDSEAASRQSTRMGERPGRGGVVCSSHNYATKNISCGHMERSQRYATLLTNSRPHERADRATRTKINVVHRTAAQPDRNLWLNALENATEFRVQWSISSRNKVSRKLLL